MQMDTLDERSVALTEPEQLKSFAAQENPVRNPKDGANPNGSGTPVNGNYSPDDEDDDEDEIEDDLILGDEDAMGDEEEFDVELEDDLVAEDIDEDDLVIDPDEDDDEDDDL